MENCFRKKVLRKNADKLCSKHQQKTLEKKKLYVTSDNHKLLLNLKELNGQ